MYRLRVLAVILFLHTAHAAAQPKPFIEAEAATRLQPFVLGNLPKLDAVVDIKAEILAGAPWGVPVERFNVPREEFKSLLAWFSDAEIDRDPITSMPEIGCVIVYTEGGNYRRICWYGGAKSPLMFSVNGIRCVSNKWNKPSDDGSRFGTYIRDLATKVEKLQR